MVQKIKIHGVGCISLDTIIRIDGKLKVGEKISSQIMLTELGGLAGRAITTASILGADCSFHCYLGSDRYSREVISKLGELEVCTEDILQVDNVKPIISTSIIDEDRLKRTVFYDKNNWSYNIENEIENLDKIENASTILIDDYTSTNTLGKIFDVSWRLGIPIVADYENLEIHKSNTLIDNVQHLIISKTFAQNLLGITDISEIVKKLWNDKKDILAITDGENGCFYKSRDSNEIEHQKAFIRKTKNTLGCGDVFHGAYAISLFKYDDFKSRMEYASAAASLRASGWDISDENISKLLNEYKV